MVLSTLMTSKILTRVTIVKTAVLVRVRSFVSVFLSTRCTYCRLGVPDHRLRDGILGRVRRRRFRFRRVPRLVLRSLEGEYSLRTRVFALVVPLAHSKAPASTVTWSAAECRDGVGSCPFWGGSAQLKFYTCGAPTARSLPEITTICPEPMTSDQMASVSLIWHLEHVGKGADVNLRGPRRGPCSPEYFPFPTEGGGRGITCT